MQLIWEDFSILHGYECIVRLKNHTYIMVTIVWKVLLVTYVAKRSHWSAQQSILPLNTVYSSHQGAVQILDEYYYYIIKISSHLAA